jgi:hypothetical protein
MSFFEELNAVCDARNAELDKLYEKQRLQAIAKEKANRRKWAVSVLEDGSLPLSEKYGIASAMMIVTTDAEIPCSEVEGLLLKHKLYRPVIHQTLVESFLERGGDPAGELGAYCVNRALSLDPQTNLFDRGAAEPLAMALLILGRFNTSMVTGAYQTLRRMFPLVKKGNLQNIPHSLARKLYSENYDSNGLCTYKFASRQETGEPRKLGRPRHYREDGDKPELKDSEVQQGMFEVAHGGIPGVSLNGNGAAKEGNHALAELASVSVS